MFIGSLYAFSDLASAVYGVTEIQCTHCFLCVNHYDFQDVENLNVANGQLS